MVIRGTVAGKRYGVAKEANLFTIKVLSDEGYVHALSSPQRVLRVD